MMAVLLLVSFVTPAIFLQNWRRPKPARIAYPGSRRTGGRRDVR
jgi:hypothetical protein